MNDERRTLMKLSADGRAVWTRIQDAYASPTNAAQRSRFDVIRAKQRALPANQQRYIRRLVRMHRDRFQRVALLSLTSGRVQRRGGPGRNARTARGAGVIVAI
jgi:hypothetical protein